VSDWPLIAVRFGVYATIAILFGLSAFGLYGLRRGERGGALTLRGWLIASSIAGLALSTSWLLLMAASMADVPLWPVDRAAIDGLLSDSAIGTAWKVRVIALLVAGLAATRTRWLPVVAASSAVALASLAWTGHGSVGERMPGWGHLGADILHLIASSAWVGALLGLILLISRPIARIDRGHLDLTHRALHGFGAVGTIVVATIVVTGLVNSWFMVAIDNLASLPNTLYGQLLLAKLALFAVMLGLAALNRFRLTPAFERSIAAADHRGALGALRRSLAFETACVTVILALVAWLGTLAPPATAM
jgi:putative copper resistance protein D